MARNRCTEVVTTACTQGKRTQHGKPHGVIRNDQPESRERCSGRLGVAERSVVPGKPGNAGGGKGPQFKIDARRREGRGDWATYQLRSVFRNYRWRYVRKRSPKPGIASTPCTTRFIVLIFWRMPMPSAALTRAHRVWMVRILPTSSRTGLNDGLANWRLRSEKRVTDRSRSGECLSRKPMANFGPWVFRPCGIGCA